MTFAEWILIAVVGYLLYRSLFPIQRRIEVFFLRIFSRGKRGNRVIDITDYNKQTRSKKDKSSESSSIKKENDKNGERI